MFYSIKEAGRERVCVSVGGQAGCPSLERGRVLGKAREDTGDGEERKREDEWFVEVGELRELGELVLQLYYTMTTSSIKCSPIQHFFNCLLVLRDLTFDDRY